MTSSKAYQRLSSSLKHQQQKEGEPLHNNLQAKLRKTFQRLKLLFPLAQAAKRSLDEIQHILVEGILKVYLSQGVRIADKHLEIVIRQMTSKGHVLDVGNTGLFQGEYVNLDRIERINLATYGKKADYEPAVLGITQASFRFRQLYLCSQLPRNYTSPKP